MANTSSNNSESVPTAYLIDDDDAVLDSMRVLLNSVGIASRAYSKADTFLEDYQQQDFNKDTGCIVLDVRMPGMGGMACLARLNELNNTLPVIIVTAHADVPLAIQAMKAGVFDFLEKPFREQTLLNAVQIAIQTSLQSHFHFEHIEETQKKLNTLSPREFQTLIAVVDGKSNKVIASELHLSERTIEIYRAHVMEKMQASSLAHLIRLYLDVKHQ